jgi:outer membrane protein assembly factor BamB
MTLDTRARQAVQGIDRAVEVMEMSTSTKVPHPIARFDRYRSHKRRNQRIGAALVAAALTIATILFVTGGFDRGQAPSPAGPVITPSNVGTLRLQWSARLDGAVPGQLTDQQTLPYPPTLANGAVYVGTQNGTLYSFPASCGSPGADCPPNWVAHLQGAAVYAPTVADDRVFVATDAGKLYAFPTDCASSCSPAWVGNVGRQFYASPLRDA